MKVLSVICARSGSKGLNNKCLAMINGKWVVRYSIEFSLSLGPQVRTVVSTDIPRLLEHCEAEGIPSIDRDPEYCNDNCRIEDALADAYRRSGQGCEYISLLYGNVPVRYPWIFHRSLEFLEENPEYDAAMSMQNVEKYHPDWMFDLDEAVVPRVAETQYRRQELRQMMIHDGHTLLFRAEGFMLRYTGETPYDSTIRYSSFGQRIKPMLNGEVIVDIDTEKDLLVAKALLESGDSEGDI